MSNPHILYRGKFNLLIVGVGVKRACWGAFWIHVKPDITKQSSDSDLLKLCFASPLVFIFNLFHFNLFLQEKTTRWVERAQVNGWTIGPFCLGVSASLQHEDKRKSTRVNIKFVVLILTFILRDKQFTFVEQSLLLYVVILQQKKL